MKALIVKLLQAFESENLDLFASLLPTNKRTRLFEIYDEYKDSATDDWDPHNREFVLIVLNRLFETNYTIDEVEKLLPIT